MTPLAGDRKTNVVCGKSTEITVPKITFWDLSN